MRLAHNFPFRPLVPAYAFSFIYMLNVTRLTGERPSCLIFIRIFRIFPLSSAAGPALPRRNIYTLYIAFGHLALVPFSSFVRFLRFIFIDI